MRRRTFCLVTLLAACGGEPQPALSPSRPAPPAGTPPDVAIVDEGDAPLGNAPPSRSILVTGPRTIGGGDEAPRKPSYSGRRIDLDVKSADLHEVCRLLADVGKVNIVVADNVSGTITVRMRNVPWDQALDTILRVKGYRAERDGNIITVFAH